MERPSTVPPPVDPRDQALFAKPSGAYGDMRSPGSRAFGATPSPARPNVPWLRRNEYQSIEMGRNTAAKAAAAAAAAPPRITAQAAQEDCSREAQLRLIETSFEKMEQLDLSKLRHPKNPSLRAVESIPLLPDNADDDVNFTAYTHCVFERPPGAQPEAEVTLDPNSSMMRKAKTAILKPMEDMESGEKFLACFLPTKRALDALESAEHEEEELDYILSRDYSYDAMPTEGNRQMMMVLQPGKRLIYSQLPTKLVLRRRRKMDIGSEANRPQRMKVRERSVPNGDRRD
ncbi:RNA polymerase II-associated [Thamnocephalis sphaerospora]|uniref:RNA polymerase II-associated n=1 Tax=Thamnocephalis sphaerospora TaxID=78915 RepID=A0A4P9XVG6_9FUNG|nr:RNA polymerase II-associated [Thamnocephalis sphaerospora]|eukprot:RKP09601.1 RNA polymerase II-associated [Thamnocephalis sphaerospora]